MVTRRRIANDSRLSCPSPKIFLASSGAGMPLAKKIKEFLEVDGSVTPCAWWDIEAFPLGEHTLESLEKAARSCEGAIIVLTPDDETKKKGRKVFSPRDNVIFEAGLFMSAFGRRRVAIVRSMYAEVLTDLDGITRLDLDPATGPSDRKKLRSNDLKKLKAWISTLHNMALPDLILACAANAIRQATRPPVSAHNGDEISFPYPAYPKFLLRLLQHDRVEIDAVEAISSSQIDYFRKLPRLGPHAATDYRDLHWYLWDKPCADSMLDIGKEAILNATKAHEGVQRTIIVPSAVPALMHSALITYAQEMRGAKSLLRFAIKEKPVAESLNRMMLSLGDKKFRATRLLDPDTNARTVHFLLTDDPSPVYRGKTIRPEELEKSLEILP